MNNENNIKEENVNELFEYHFYKKETRNTKIVTTSVMMRGLERGATTEQNNLATHFKSIKRRYSQSMEYSTVEDFIQEYAILFTEAAYQLDVLEPMRILLDDPETHKIRLGFIKTYITNKFNLVANPQDIVVNTSSGRKYISADVADLGQEVESETGSVDYLINLIPEDRNIFAKHESNYNHFIMWILENENYKNILTKRQSEIFEKLLDTYQPLSSRSKETLALRKAMLEDIQLSNTHIDRTFKAIKKRCNDAYKKSFDTDMKSHVTANSEKLHDVLNNYIEQANYPNWETANERQEVLTNLITTNYENEEFELIITKELTKDEIVNIVRATKEKEMVSHKVLRKVNNNIEKYLTLYNPMEVEPSLPSYEYKEDTFSGLGKMEGKGGRITPSGTVEYRDEDGNYKTI